MMVIPWGLLGVFAVFLTWAKVTQRREVYRALWWLVMVTVFMIGLVL